MVILTKQSNIKAFLELFIGVFRLTCELILGAHVGIILIVVIPVLWRDSGMYGQIYVRWKDAECSYYTALGLSCYYAQYITANQLEQYI
jgi:hypothetical protein